MLRILSISLLVLALGGCSTAQETPDIHYYLLDDVPSLISETIQTNNSNSLVQISKIQLPDYLKQRQLVTKQNNNQIKIANYHSWADDLGDSIQRVLIGQLNAQKTQNLQYIEYCRDCAKVEISIAHFYPTEEGSVILSGRVSVLNENGNIETVNDFLFKEKLVLSGYDNSVTQMRQLLNLLSGQIKELNL